MSNASHDAVQQPDSIEGQSLSRIPSQNTPEISSTSSTSSTGIDFIGFFCGTCRGCGGCKFHSGGSPPPFSNRSVAHRLQAEALELEAAARRRLADEYDAAQDRGEVATGSVRTDIVTDGNDVRPATASELGLSRKEIFEARRIRDAEAEEPGFVRRVLDEKLEAGEAPTRADINRKIEAKKNPHVALRRVGLERHGMP